MRIKNYLLSVLILLCSYNITAQVVTPFTQRLAGGNLKLKGDIIFVGNNIVNRTTTNPTYDAANNVTNQAVLTAEANTPYNGGLANNNFNFDYIDIDGDPTTFSSSTADLNITVPCKKIIYAGLYWTATYPFERIKSNGTITIPRQNDWNQVKFKLPGGAYQTLVADNAADPVGQEDDIIVDNNTSNTNGVYGVPYVCYKNVTSLLQGLADANGTYGVANQRGQLGKYTNTGSSAGWSIVIVYESPSLPSKYISIFDGYANIDGSGNVDFNVNGFVTLPPPFPVRARIGVGALEGDLEYTGDNLRFKANSLGGFTTITNGLNPNNNFFNSSITNNNIAITNRNINSSNTLGFDLDLVQVNNPLNAVVPNNETGATLRLTTNGDSYGAYLATFDVEIIEPKIILTKTVADLSGADVGGQNVTLCQPLNYTIGFQNIGNDDADIFTIKDILPPNVSFNPASVVLPTPPVTVPATPPITFTYNAGTRTIIFTIPKGFVPINAPRYTIQLGVKVLCTCLELDDACSNLITNQAFATYQGVLNVAQITNDPSLSSYTVCNLSGASPTNTLVGLDACNFTQDVVLCGTTVTLTAAGGYTTYTWSGPPGATITPVAGTNNQSVVVNQVGTYTVNNLITTTPCKSIVQTINVVDITGTPPLTNPVLPYADQIVICPNDGKQLPLIFLCGAADSQLIATTITGATSISWEQLNTASCVAVVNPNCANENPACTWTVVGTGLNYTANTAGQFRVVINYPGGCSRIFYFNVFQNLLNPIATPRDAVCSTPGQITITGVPAGYEYSLDCTGTWQASNVFTTVPVGVHSVCIRQTGITGGCVFTLTNIPIVNRVFTVSAILTQPICSGNKGSINLAANNVLPQYTFSINQGATLISTFGPTNSSSTVFNNLTPGNYTYTVTTQDGCSVTTPFTIIQPPLLTITAALTKPLTCGPGEITVYPVGGTPPYNFNVTGAVTVTQSSPIISAPVAGTYNIQVVDNNNCTANTSITVALVPPPVYTVTQTNVLCYGSNTGAINFNVTNANGFTLQYSIDGITFFPTPNFPNLVAGTYTIIVRYTLGTAVCLTTPVTITITQPAAALTASAGVSELAGCGPLGEGRVRIINPQGGVPAYTYSFDNGATYTGVNQAYLLPGTYTVYIKDANGCIFPMTVTLDPAPAAPTIVVTPPVFACNGNATSTVTVNNNGGSFSYTYLLDGVPNTPPTNNVFSPVTCGPHTVTVNYQATNIPTPSNLLFEDFGIGANTTTPGIAAAYCFNPQAYPAGQPCGNAVAGFPASACGTWFVNDNQYVVTSLLNPNNCAWFPYRDHTSNGTNPKGRFLAVNIGSAAGPNGVLYSKTINNVLPNQPVIVDIYLANLLTVGNGGADPSFILELVNGSGTVIASQSTGIIDNTVNAWQLKSLTLNPGANTTLTFKIRSGSIIYSGNDAAIDDINVYQQPIACITTKNFPINIACNQAFTAQVTGSNNVSCNGGNNGTITISAQNFAATGFQYSTNGGATWTTSLVSPVTISGLTATTYNIQIRYDSNPANTACSFPFTTIITQPAVLTPSVVVTPATCLTGATITVSAVGGTPAYQYQLQTSPGAVIVTAYQASGTFTNVATGNYVVLVRDANLCVSTSIPLSVVAATPPTATISAASNFCYSSPAGATIVVTAAGGVAPYAYNINGGAFQVSNTFPNLTPGSYTIIVRDAFGCTVTLPVQTIAPQLTLSTVLTKDLDCTASPNAVITGTIVGGYSPFTYQVSFNAGAFTNLGATTSPFTYSTAIAGTYQFQVTDSRGCTAQSIVHTVNALIPVAATHTQTNNLCFGDAAGTVTITPSGGVAPYQVNFNGLGFSSTFTYSGLAAGTYTYIVRDSKSCTFNGSVTITQPAQIAYTAIVNPITCNISGSGYALGSICVNGLTGGVAPYTYTLVDLTGGSATLTHVEPLGANYCFPSVDFGLYDLSVTDANGCTIVKSNLVMASPPGGLTFTFASVATCATGADLTVSIAGGIIGSGPYEFGIVNLTAFPWSSTFVPANPGPSTHIFTGLIPGSIYTIVVRDLTTGCYYFQTAPTAATLSNINVTPLVANPVTCKGSADGSVTFSLTGIDPTTTTIHYSIHYASNNLPVGAATDGILTAPFVFPVTVGPLAPGSYNIQIVEYVGVVRGCGVTSTNFTIVESATALTLSATTTNDNCNVNAGHITPTASGGTGPYLYQYLPSPSVAPTATLPGLWGSTNPFNGESGNYDVYVRDAFGCIKKVTVAIGLDPSPVIAATLVNACVAQGTYQINVTMPTAGIAPYTFSVDGGAFVANTTPFTISGLSSGTHTIQVKDKNGCGNTVSVTILTPLIVSAVFTTQPTCFNNNGTITASASGGSAPANYTYTLLTSGSVVIVGPQGSNVFAGQPAGCYIIRVTDSTTGCSANTPFCLTLPTPVTFTAVPTSVTCNGGTDGTITINLTGASDNPPYTYQINAPIVVGPQASNIFTGLAAGTYTVQVNSGRGCTLIDNNVIVGTPTPVVASASATPFTCAANNSVNVSVLTVNGAGGTPAYTYSINGVNYFTTNTFNIINTGAVQNITVYVKDSKGCIDTEVIIINPLPAITAATVTQTTAITCTNPELVTITVTGGSGTFTYQTLPLGAANVTQVGITNQFNISAPGTYFFQVNDITTGCYFATLAYTVAPYNTIDVVATASTPVSCFGSNNGAISINVSGYTGAYSYTVLGSLPLVSGVGNTAVNPLVISGLPAGSYTVQVTETASPFCVKISNVVTVASPSQVSLSLASNINANCNSGAQVTVIGSGGTPAYTYAFVQNGFIPVLADYTASNTAVLNPATNTQWDVYVKDANGCFTFIDVTIATDVLPTVTLPTFASDQCTSTGTSYTFTATGTGLAPLTYSIGAGFQSSGTFTVSAPGVYTVTIKDKNGCTASTSITVYPPIGVNPSITALPSCANNDGSITVNTVGGSGTYNYSIAPNLAGITLVGNVFSNVPSGTYTITVTDVLTTCTKNVSVTLSTATPVTFTAVPTNVSCSGGTDGTITVNLAAGNNNPVYTYQITAGPVTTAVQTANVFTGLPTGTYTIQVISGRGCQLIDNNVIVGTPNPIVVPATTITQFGCAAGTNAVNLATITVTGVTGGSGVYTNYEFILGGVIQQSGSSNTYSTANVVGGTYTINVFDNKGCLGTTTAVINPYISISNPTVVVNNPITCTTNEQITISVTTAGGVPPVFTYTVTGYPTNAIPYNVTQNSPTFTGLTIGDYIITVLNPVTGCSVQTIHYVNNPNTFDLLLNNVVDVTCFGGNNGSVNITIVDNDLTPTNDAGPFNYTILNSLGAPVTSGSSATAGPITISGLPSGIYTANVSLIATPFCTVTKNFTISGPTSGLTVSTTSTPITCVTGNNDGTITASATGGWGAPYEFQLQIGAAIITSYSSNPNFTGLSQGTYTVYVKDVRGCITSTNVTLTNPLPINAVITSSGPTVACFGDCNATISISYPTGGQGSNYSYVLHSTIPTVSDSGPIAIPLGGIVLTGLCADTYTVTITDGFDCSFTSANIVIAQPAKVVASLSTATTQTCLTQATLTLTGSGGTPPYSYSTTPGGPFIGSFNPSIIIPVPVGTYHYYIQDANGCNSLVSGDVIITPLDPLTISSLSHQDILCGGSSTGTISATATGGLLNYVYTLLDGAGNPILPAPTQTTPGNFSNLPAGTYIVHVQSLDCPKDSPSIIITEPTPFNVAYTPIPVKCNGGNDGAVNLVITGGTGAIQYAISPNLSQFITISNPYVAGGFNVPNLASGSYTIIIQDQNGCFVTFNNITINQPTALTSNITSFVDEDCAELDLGEITVGGIGGGTAPYSVTYTVVYPGSTTVVTSPIIALAAGVTTYNFTGLNGGNYTTIVIDGNGCKSENQQLLGSGVLYDPRAEVTYPCVSNSPAVRVEVLNLSNTPSLAFTPLSDYLFSLDVNSSASAQASNIFTSAAYPSLLISGVPHTIYVFHVNGCDKATNSFTINATDIDPLNLSLTQVFLNQLVATLNPVTGGTAPYTYTFQDETGATVQNGPNNIHIYDHSATYTVTVTDSKGCTDTATKAVVFIPIKIDNVYTPGDGSGWGPKNTSNYPDIVTYIYDRYGRKVAELLEGQKWYGKYNGQELPSGDYWYVIKVDAGNDSEYVGHFTLYR
ncbi:T9SS type B sorting domain-containing protein [Flavobacterium sp.]|uniref:T9SS type B sorting domain-containing protein n=1 Tax=Flavobacterium sp. TaxID=239 RepID=UPI0038FD3328